MKIDKEKRNELQKRYPYDVINRAAKEASNDEELNELLELYLDAYYKAITRKTKETMLNVSKTTGGMCHM